MTSLPKIRKSEIRVLFPLMPVSTTKKHHLKKTNKQTNKQIANLDIIRAKGTWELLTVLFLMLDRFFSALIAVIIPLPAFYFQVLIRNSRYWRRFNYFDVTLGNFVLDPAINNSLIDISRYSQHSTTCVDAIRRNSAFKLLEGGSNPFT